MKVLIGKVISNRTVNTIIVEVERSKIHPLYKKILKRTKKYKVHYDKKDIQIGDTVSISETRPMSKDKYFKLHEIIKNKKDNK